MKKTFNINLGGMVFHIDEDAYELLDKYLNNLRSHFKKEEGGEEIVHDIELRISELFTERMNERKQVITLSDVEEIIAQVGKLEELTGEAADEETSAPEEKSIKRLYRDPDNKLFGGVCSGLAAYLGWDTTLLRLCVLLFCCFINGGVLAYIIAWIVIPMAETASEKLSMRGKEVNVKNIGETVTDGFDKSNVSEASQKKSFLYKVGEAIVSVCSILIKIVLIILAVILTPVFLLLLFICFTLLLASVGVIGSVPVVLFDSLPYGIDWSSFVMTTPISILLPVCGILLIGLPIVAIIHYFMSTYGSWRPMPVVTRIVFIVLWMVALFVGAICFAQYGISMNESIFQEIHHSL